MKHLMAWILIAFFFTPVSLAGEYPEEIQIAVISDVPITAAAAHILQLAYQRLGVRMTTVHSPARRALMMADTGLVDGGMFRTSHAANIYPNLVQVEHVLLKGELRAVVLPGNGHVLNMPSTKPRKVAVRRGVIIAERMATELGMEPVSANTYEQARQLLKYGRVDVAFISHIEDFGPLALKDWQEFEILPEPVTRFNLYHFLNQRHEALAKALPNVLRQIEEEGTKKRILDSFRGRPNEGSVERSPLKKQQTHLQA